LDHLELSESVSPRKYVEGKQMIVHTEYSDIPLPGSPMRTFGAAPKAEGEYPGIWCHSDIFQLTPPLLRFCVRLAGYGFVAAAPEIYRRIEPPGTVIPFDDAGRTRGQQDAAKTPVTHFDEDCRSGLDWLSKHPKVARGKIGVTGFCIGGHLAFRAAFQPDVRATVCYYGTGIHDGKLGQDADAGSLSRAREIRGELLMIFGTKDPHVPDAGRETIDGTLRNSGVHYNTLLYPAEHAFTRDEGPRFDPEATDLAFAEMIRLFRKVFED
jgi:carboxymethylenebutenolidase